MANEDKLNDKLIKYIFNSKNISKLLKNLVGTIIY